MEVESELQSRRSKGASEEVSVNRLLLTPTLGLDLSGSVYHPNFLQYDLHGQGGVGWEQLDVSGPGTDPSTGTRDGERTLQRYDARFYFMRQQPYKTTLFATKGHTFRDVDFYERVIADTQSYGLHSGYTSGRVPTKFSFTHLEQTERGLVRSLDLTENNFSLDAQNERARGKTLLSYTFNEFSHHEAVASEVKGLVQTVVLTDTESFGRNDFGNLNSSLVYSRLDNPTLPSENFTASEYAVLKHTKRLRSEYTFNYDARLSAAAESEGEYGRTLLRHQLGQSLTSTVDLEGQLFDSASPGASFRSARAGIGAGENYMKRIGNWGRLGMGYNWRGSLEERETKGRVQQIIGERHTLTDGQLIFLNQPLVVRSSVRVTDPTGALLYTENLDYTVLEHGVLTEIRRVVGATRIPDGGTILVDYRVASPPSSSFTTQANQAHVRLGLFENLLAFYGRLNLVEHNGADKSVLLQEIADYVAGVDVTWRWFHGGFEYEDFDSNLTPFESTRLFETFSFEPQDSSTLTLDFDQSRHIFRDSNITETSYRFMLRYKWHITHAVNWDLEGGMRIVRGRGLDQDLGVMRTGIEYAYGRLRAGLTYQFEDENFLGEMRRRHLLFFHVKRTF